MPFNPNAVFISPSSLGDFDKCPQLYFLRSVYKNPITGLKLQLINPALALGQTVHDVIDQFTSMEIDQRKKDELFSIFDRIWQNISGTKGGFNSDEEEQTYKNRGLAMIERFLKNNHFLITKKTKIPDFPKVHLTQDLILTGKLDWIEDDSEGFHVIDFKTGQNEEKETSAQLPIYALLAKNILQTEVIKTSYWYLDKEDSLTPFKLPDLEEFAKAVTQKGTIIQLARQTNSFSCQSGKECCWACKDMFEIKNGKGKLVAIDSVRKQEIYILDKTPKPEPLDLPF